MMMFLTCRKCGRAWTVERWSPAAMRCPKCGSYDLTDGVGDKAPERAAARQKEIERRTRIEQQYKKART
jgi:PHP family Zn ribbon phosphoesterase